MKSVSDALLAEDDRIKTREAADGFAAAALPTPSAKCPHGRQKGRCWTCDPSQHPSKLKCQDCKKIGHRSMKSERCAKFEPVGTAGVVFEADAERWSPLKPFAGMANSRSPNGVHKKTRKSLNDLRFVIDSGCSQTLLNNKEQIQNYTNVNFEMQTASTDVLTCPGKGDVDLNSDIRITNAMFSPNASMNLLSVSQLCDLGNRVHFDAQHATVYNRSGRVVLRGKRVGGLYLFKQTLPSSEAVGHAMTTKSSENTTLFHRRMGHINIQSLRLLSHISHGVVLDGNPTELCVPCTQAKAHRKSFLTSTSHASRIGELVHTDVCYIGIPTIIGDYKLFVLFVDDCTRYTVIYLLTHKSDAAAAFKDYDKKLFNMIGRHTTTLRSDGGKEYFNNTLKEYCNLNGISQQSSTPYTPQQNGRAERPNRNIVEGVSAMLLDSCLPWEFWGFAAQTYVYLKNRSPHAALPQSTPYAQWFKTVPDLSAIRVFGSKGHVLIPSEKRKGPGSKLMPKTQQMIMIGYSDIHKAYKMFDEESLNVTYSAEVIFDNEKVNTRKIAYPKSFVEHVATQSTFSYPSVSSTNPVETEEAIIALPPESSSTEDPIDEPIQSETETPATTSNDISTDVAIGENTDEYESSDDELISYYTNKITSDEFALLMSSIPNSPTYAEAMKGEHAQEFKAAIAKEYASLKLNNVFSEPCQLPKGKTSIGTKMVLKIKESESNDVPRKFKARLCGKGFKQVFGVDYHNTYAPVAAYNSLRMFISICASIDYEMDNIDVVTAFLHAKLDEEIYIAIPDGYPTKPGQEKMVLRLQKSLYGLKQSPYAWNKELDTYLQSLGFKPTESERCIYVGKWDDTTIYLLVYVDDIIVGASNRILMASVKSKINERFPIEDNGPLTFYLNIHFSRNWKEHTISIHQEPKIAKVINDARYTAEDRLKLVKSCKIPASSDITLSKKMCPTDPVEIEKASQYPYKSILGQLLYISITARPDIATAVSACGRFAQNPGQQHWDALLQIVRYLQGTRKLRLKLGGATKISLTACADADWAGDIDERNSRTGYTISMDNSLITWSSKLQQSVAQSSTEAEYVALTDCARTLIWCRTLLAEMGFAQRQASVIEQDNNNTINIANSYKQHPGIKHIDIRHHFIRDRIINLQDIVLQKKPTQEMKADLLTKQLPFPAFARHREMLGLYLNQLKGCVGIN